MKNVEAGSSVQHAKCFAREANKRIHLPGPMMKPNTLAALFNAITVVRLRAVVAYDK